MPKNKKLFISHSSQDKPLVDKFVDLLQTGCNVGGSQALCTTLEGMGIPVGTENWIQFLREELKNCSLVILLISPNFLESRVCLCELGAAWAAGVEIFPLVVPPQKVSEVKATLSVTQAKPITEESALDELRDRLQSILGTQQATPRWTVKRDQFLDSIRDIIRDLPPPKSVPLQKLLDAQSEYKEAREELKANNSEIEELINQIDDLKKLKDKKEVEKVERRYSTTEDQLDSLCTKAAKFLREVQLATRRTLFAAQSGNNYFPKPGELDDVAEAVDFQEIDAFDPDEGYRPKQSHPRVKKAVEALEELENFIHSAELENHFATNFAKSHNYLLDVRNKAFWAECLVAI